MGFLSDLIAAPIRIVNAPLRAIEDICSPGERVRKEDRVLSRPLDHLADAVGRISSDNRGDEA